MASTKTPVQPRLDLREAALAALCRRRFDHFCREFWDQVPGTQPLKWNWHLDVFCTELQKVAERVFAGLPRLYDLVFNVPPGTSKSSFISILFHCWVWTRMAKARFITGSHADDLAIDLSNRARQVVKSEKYRRLFPDVAIAAGHDGKGAYTNTAGGDRHTCTVAGKSPIGLHGHFIIIDDPLDPKEALSEVKIAVAEQFMTQVIPSRKVDKEIAVTILVMQRLGVMDCTDVMLDASRKPGAAPVRHICLPAELDGFEVHPPELANRYVDGLMDPVRLSTRALAEAKAKGQFYYATQFGQKPFHSAGGMFKRVWFNNRVKAAPYQAARVRYWDKGATQDAGCNTVGTLMCRADDGNFYVEDVVAGKWEPDEREEIVLATAIKDRARYGPSYEPVIYIEHEPGSAGVDAFKYSAKKLAGFRVKYDRPTGKKAVRAEPWACQCAAKNVILVDNGERDGAGKATWDIEAWIQEHLAFPTGRLVDRVDSASGAFGRLIHAGRVGPMRVLPLRDQSRRQKQTSVYVCDRRGLQLLNPDGRVLLVSFRDPEPGAAAADVPMHGLVDVPPPPHGIDQLLGAVTLTFADLDPADVQDRWDEPVFPYERPPADVVMRPEHGKRFWSVLLRKRDPWATCFVFQDDGDRRALSAAYAFADALGIPRKAIAKVGDPDNAHDGRTAPNPHVYAMVKRTRSSVV